ncbi:TPA: hypothetical protein ACJG4U_003086, partial [Salmonella enterica subsp. diarizonae]
QVFKRKLDGFIKILDIVSDDDAPYIVRMRGFFGLGERFFSDYNFNNKFITEQEDGFDNPVYMPDSNLRIQLIVDEEVTFNIESLFILKKDFIAIKEASNTGVELTKKYTSTRISNNHGWWKYWTLQPTPKNIDESKKTDELYKKSNSHIKEMHSTKREAVLEAAINIKTNKPELCRNNTKWAEAIHDHAYVLFGGECPLSLESTKRLLGKATKKQKDTNKKR